MGFKELFTLDLSGNQINDTGIATLIEVFTKNDTLSVLSLAKMEISMDHLEALLQALQFNQSLKHFAFYFPGNGNAAIVEAKEKLAAMHFRDLFKTNFTLWRIDGYTSSSADHADTSNLSVISNYLARNIEIDNLINSAACLLNEFRHSFRLEINAISKIIDGLSTHTAAIEIDSSHVISQHYMLSRPH